MDNARISELLEPFLQNPLSESQLQQISKYIDLLLKWNARINLTAIRKQEEIVTRHFGESFFLARHVFPCEELPNPAGSPHSPQKVQTPLVMDIGSGAGFPGVPVKLWAPAIHLALIESNHKKSAFLREVSRELALTNVNVFNERLEVLMRNPEHARPNVVTLRAVENLEATLTQAIKLLPQGATVALLISGGLSSQIETDARMCWNSEIPIPKSERGVLRIGKRH